MESLMPTFEFPETYTSTDGEYSFAWGSLHPSTIVAAATKALNHVFGNEAISKGSTAKTKAGVVGDAYTESFSKAMYDAIVREARDKYHAEMGSGSWATPGRGPRMPAENRLEAIFNVLCAQEARAVVNKSPAFRAVDGDKNKWIVIASGNEFTIERAMKSYLDNPELGAERRARLEQRAKLQHDKEVADAALRKAAKDAENGGAKAETAEGELVI